MSQMLFDQKIKLTRYCVFSDPQVTFRLDRLIFCKMGEKHYGKKRKCFNQRS